MGLLEPTDDGRFRVSDVRFLDTGAALAELGVPTEVILDEWEHLARHTDAIAKRFVAVFEDHLLPADWRRDLDADRIRELGTTLARLQHTAGQVLLASLDASVAAVGAKRLAELVPDSPRPRLPPPDANVSPSPWPPPSLPAWGSSPSSTWRRW